MLAVGMKRTLGWILGGVTSCEVSSGPFFESIHVVVPETFFLCQSLMDTFVSNVDGGRDRGKVFQVDLLRQRDVCLLRWCNLADLTALIRPIAMKEAMGHSHNAIRWV